ncbi:3D domain-containing protein [Paenibacillus cisolokensis]|nr:3D domain-containing protein [Paenibacillus cisolokensis]
MTYEEPAAPEPEWLTFEATAYTADCRGCIGITKTGIDVRQTQYHEGRRVVAVDPREIPLGTALDIRLADGTVIEAIAEDTGGAIKGTRLDVLMATEEEAYEFGRQDVEVRIINEKETEE